MESSHQNRPRDALTFSSAKSQLLTPYLPGPDPVKVISGRPKPHVTLTFATSLDSNLAIVPGEQTHLSGPESKAMTHYLRSEHESILVGVGTVIADNPSLNCRLEGVGGYGGKDGDGQPFPILVEPFHRWNFDEGHSKCLQLAKEGKGKPPFIVSATWPPQDKSRTWQDLGGKYHLVPPTEANGRMNWGNIFEALSRDGFTSVMVEGGGTVINELLSPQYFHLVDSVIITVAPTWLGKGGVQVCPDPRVQDGGRVPVGRLKDVKWVPLGEDVVLCGRPKI